MKNTLELFRQQKADTLQTLQNLREFLADGESFGVEIDANIKKKLNAAMESVNDEKMRVVLIGGFSEGKTAIAAAWLERLDQSSMKISHEESSSEIMVYQVDADCVLVDTPGLFGFKEQMDGATGKMEKYRELTQRHISQSHLILYVMNSTNPIKESHREELHWIFRELALLSRTVFVLSRFDDVADIEDAQDYAYHAEIKKGNVRDRLRAMLALDDAEVANLSIVAVAGNPFNRGTDYWLENLEEFRHLSRIPLLQLTTREKIRQTGGAHAIADEARRSIVRDVLHTQLPIAVQGFTQVDRELGKLQNMHTQLAAELAVLSRQATQAQAGLRDFVTRFFTDLIAQAKNVTIETFQDFFDNNIGHESAVLKATLQNAFDKYLGSVQLGVDNMSIGFATEINHFEESMRQYGKLGIRYVASSGMLNGTSVIAARNALVSGAKMIGLDIGKSLAFKPWGAIKLAKNLGAVLVLAGAVMEIWDSLERQEREGKFRKAVADLVIDFEKQRKDLLQLIDDTAFVENCLPGMAQLRTNMELLEDEMEKSARQRQKFGQWRQQGEAIKIEFLKNTGQRAG